MRNLSLFKTSQLSLAGKASSSTLISAVAVDLDENALYIATEKQTPDADVEVEIWKVEGDAYMHEINLQESATLVATVRSQAYLSANPWSSPFGKPAEVVSFKLLPDTRTLVVILRGGEIATASLEDEVVSVEVVGGVDAGILAAAWSPDDSLVVLATGDEKMILMTSTFDVVSENALHREDFGEDAPINVGWGSKQTQFHGSLGKAAAQAPKPATIGLSPDDDELPRISWRGDGAYYTISSVSLRDTNDLGSNELGNRRRTIRMYSHTGILQSTLEPTPGLEHALSWRPSGNWIVSTQRYGFPGGGEGREGRHDVVLFERNGLRRHDFLIDGIKEGLTKSEGSTRKWGYRVKEIGWSSDSNILSLWIEKDAGDVVQLWTIGNYHWYLKHEISAPTNGPEAGRFTSVVWHPEDACRLILTTPTNVLHRSYTWETYASPAKPPYESGSVAVLDGQSVLLTPFRTQNIPPPMSSYQLVLRPPSPNSPKTQSRYPVHVSFFPNRDMLGILWETGYAEVWDLKTRLSPGRGKVVDPVQRWSGLLHVAEAEGVDKRSYRQILLVGLSSEEGTGFILSTLSSHNEKDFVTRAVIQGTEVVKMSEIALPEKNGRLIPAEDDNWIWWQLPSGEVSQVNFDENSTSLVAGFPEFCSSTERAYVASLIPTVGEGAVASSLSGSLFIGHAASANLYVSNSVGTHQLLASNVNSFTIASGFLIYATTAHAAHFAPLSSLLTLLGKSRIGNGEDPLSSGDVEVPQWETRRVERGSRIVVAVPSTMNLVLQMPRGNLETISPRPMVMEVVKQDIDGGNFSKAFSACRRHRIDLNIFVEHNKDMFMLRLGSFVEQVDDIDYINLFLTNIGQGSLSDEVKNQVCDGVRMELEKKDLKKYVSSILTAHVMKRPADHEAGLSLLLHLRDTEPQLVEDAVKYIIFLVDANSLFDTALGMYDFSLVLMIAQHAQKDPREYLPFLRELRALEKFYQRFKIDDYLKRYEKALKNMSMAGEDRFEESMAYVEKHRLYESALEIYKDTEKYEMVLNIYGDWLYERREFKDAAFVFRQARKFPKAMLAYEKAHDWQELFEIAIYENIPEEDISETAYRVAEDLSSKKRYQDTARVLLDYAKDVRGAVIALVQGNSFSEARRILTLYSKKELLEEIVYPAALESRAQIAEDISEMKDQLRKQVARLRELRIKKVEEPDSFYGTEDIDLHNVDVMTDVSMAPTAFTRYTVAPSAASRTSSKRSSRSKRKLERKVGSGRKGTVDEEEYLLKSVAKLVGRFNITQVDVINLLPHLFQFTAEHHTEGLELQEELNAFSRELKDAVEDIWKKSDVSEEETSLDGWAARMREHEKQKQIDPMDKVGRPEIVKQEWNQRLNSVGRRDLV